jgi:hypothetical protein
MPPWLTHPPPFPLRHTQTDSLTIQAEEMKQHCTPDPVRGVACEYYIGVLGWTNTSFSIQASLNRGWEDPMVRGHWDGIVLVEWLI